MMASATNGASPTTPSSTSLSSALVGQKDASSRQTKANTTKVADRGRKESPVDQTRRPQQKAWTGGANLLTQKSAVSTNTNGSAAQSKSTAGPKMSDKQSHERLCFVLGGALGLGIVLTTKHGDKFEGILASSSLSGNTGKLVLHMTKKTPSSLQTNGVAASEAALVGTSPEHAMTFEIRDAVDITIAQFKLPDASKQANGASSSFQTDTDISANAGKTTERVLQPWVPDGPDTTDFSLESGSIGGWDQFAAHKQKFGDHSTYDENLYTTAINRNAPDFARREATARRMANAINAEVSTLSHVREERGQTTEGDRDDEEDKYSGVRREDRSFPPLATGGANKYMPPARRAPTAQPTVPGAPVDSAIISAQLSKPTKPDTAASKPPTGPKNTSAVLPSSDRAQAAGLEQRTQADASSGSPAPSQHVGVDDIPGDKPEAVPADGSSQHNHTSDNSTEDVEVQVLDKFRQFANIERQRYADRKRAQVSQDRTAKLNDLVRFSKTFKLKTPIPTDLVGILAKSPDKQEAIVTKANKDYEDAKTLPTTSPATASSSSTKTSSAVNGKPPAVPKFDSSQVPPPIPLRDTFNRGRGGLSQQGARNDRTSQPPFLSRGAPSFGQRPVGQQDRKGQVPAPIALHDGRVPPTGPLADQVPSPHRSAVHTPTSAASTRLNVKAMEFRPNVNAPAFNPTAATNAPSSPASIQRTPSSISRSASPSSFFGARKPKPASERIAVSSFFDPVSRMRKDIEKRKAEKQENETVKDYPANGGIPNAYHTAPTWTVTDENKDRKYLASFARPGTFSPNQSRSSSAQHVAFQGQMLPGPNGMPHMANPPHSHPSGLGHHFDDNRAAMQGQNAQVYPSPGMSIRQMSNFTSPMAPQAQLAYGQQHYYGGPGRVPVQMRQYPGTPNVMHAQPGQVAAPMMMQQPSNGPYMAVPQQYNQMPMYSPTPGHVFPQPNGYPSPGRMAPMMMHQGSQHSHHGGQPMVYGMSNQGNPLGYANQGAQMMGMQNGYGVPPGQYGSSPHQPPHMQQRAMSSGYNQRNASQSAAPIAGQGPPANAPQQPAAFTQLEMTTEDGK